LGFCCGKGLERDTETDMKQKLAIISGITGQDGAYLSRLLLQKGYSVIGLTRSYTGLNIRGLQYLSIDKSVHIEECDLMDLSVVLKILNRYKPAEFYNLGAQSSVGLSFEQPIGTISYNTISVLNVLETIRILKLDTRFYQASSSEMFGRVTKLPINEETALHPLSPYAISKAAAYWTCINYRESYDIYATNGVLFNHESYLRAPNFFVKKVIRSAFQMKQHQLDYLHLGNIDIRRDFGYAPDYVEAMHLSLQQSQPGDYFICSGESVLLKDIVEYVFDKLSIPHSKIVVDPKLYRPVEILDLYGDNGKAQKQLGWSYSKSFFQVLDTLVEEEKANLN
jgi:GDPmannose 4,6-dehydratase